MAGVHTDGDQRAGVHVASAVVHDAGVHAPPASLQSTSLVAVSGSTSQRPRNPHSVWSALVAWRLQLPMARQYASVIVTGTSMLIRCTSLQTPATAQVVTLVPRKMAPVKVSSTASSIDTAVSSTIDVEVCEPPVSNCPPVIEATVTVPLIPVPVTTMPGMRWALAVAIVTSVELVTAPLIVAVVVAAATSQTPDTAHASSMAAPAAAVYSLRV